MKIKFIKVTKVEEKVVCQRKKKLACETFSKKKNACPTPT